MPNTMGRAFWIRSKSYQFPGKNGPTLTGTGRGKVDDHAVLRTLEAGVDYRPFDAVRAFLYGRLGQADQDGLRQSGGRDIDFHLDRQRVDAQQRECLQFSKHGGIVPSFLSR